MRSASTIEILGGGPAGLYAAILVRRLMPHVERTRHRAESPRRHVRIRGGLLGPGAGVPRGRRPRDPRRHRPGDGTLARHGPPPSAGRGDDRRRRVLRRRKTGELIEILCARVRKRSAQRFASRIPIRHLDELDGDLIVGADGVNSLVRRSDKAAFCTAPCGALRQPFRLVRNAIARSTR